MRPVIPVLLLLALPATASAQQPPKPTLSVDLQKVGYAEEAVTLAGHGFRVRGTLEPYAPGQWVKTSVYLNGRLLSAKAKRAKAVGDGAVGMFVANFRTRLTGKLKVVTTHAASGQRVRSGPVHVIDGSIAYGQTGYSVQVMQRLLRDKGYVVGRYGVNDDRTSRAVQAFRKLEDMARTSTANGDMLRRLIDGGGEFEVRYPKLGHHAEGDLTHQVLALIDDGQVERIYPMSSGAPATPTILGNYRVYLKGAGTNAKGMVHSSFFIRGFAIHGYASVPTYPASHGCLRVPVPDAWDIYEWLDMGDWVSTYYRGSTPRGTAAFNPRPGP